MKKAILYFAVFIVLQLAVPFLINQIYRLIAGTEVPSGAPMLIISMTASSIAILILFLYMRWAEVSRSYVRSQPWATLIWCALAAAGAIIPSTCLQESMPQLPNFAEQELDVILRNSWGYFAVGLLVPVCEEIVFRGAILRALLRWGCPTTNDGELAAHCIPGGHWTAIGLSALIFALAHFNPAQMPHALLIGLLLGWLYYRTDSVVPGVVFHWVNNSIAYIIYNLYPNPSIKLVDILGNQRTVAAAVIFSLFILLPALYQLNLRLRKAS